VVDNAIRGGKGAYRAMVLDIAVFFFGEVDEARGGKALGTMIRLISDIKIF
jgi:hypothetical protein